VGNLIQKKKEKEEIKKMRWRGRKQKKKTEVPVPIVSEAVEAIRVVNRFYEPRAENEKLSHKLWTLKKI
jgi:hypothetical protein